MTFDQFVASLWAETLGTNVATAGALATAYERGYSQGTDDTLFIARVLRKCREAAGRGEEAEA